MDMLFKTSFSDVSNGSKFGRAPKVCLITTCAVLNTDQQEFKPSLENILHKCLQLSCNIQKAKMDETKLQVHLSKYTLESAEAMSKKAQKKQIFERGFM